MSTEQPPIFRVFVSSTFTDFQPERDYLERHVFPKIRQFCEARGSRFQHVDLRWGISESAAREMMAAELCELELQRCQRLSPRPNFVILAGDRYGWCPPPRKISEADWGPLLQTLPKDGALFLSEAYQRDDFAVPPEYLLRPDHDLIPTVQAILRSASEQAFAADPSRRLRYEASITHQEIWSGALAPQTPVDHIFLFHRQFHALPSETLEPNQKSYGDYLADGRLDQSKFTRQRELCQQLQRLLPETSKYSAKCDLDEWTRQSQLEELGQRLEQHLCRVIEEELAARNVSPSPQKPKASPDVIEDLVGSAIPRDDLLNVLLSTARQFTGTPTFVLGPSGTGKSTLLAMLLRRLQATNDEVLWFSPAQTSGGADLTSFLNHVCAGLASRLKVASQPSGNSTIAAKELVRLLGISDKRKFYLILDGLDQLETSDRAHELWWLPGATVPQTTIIASVAVEPSDSTVIGRALVRRFQSSNQIEVGALGPEQAMQAVDHHLARQGRLIAGPHREIVRKALVQNSTALFARLISQVAATWRSYGVAAPLPQDSVALFQEICTKWSLDSEHGPHLVRTVLGSLSVARTGLTEDEILDLVSRSAAVRNEIRTRFPRAPKRDSLPFAVWARLSNDLQPFVAELAAERRLALYHGKLRAATLDWAAPDLNARRAIHSALAGYFQERGLKSARTASRSDSLIRRFLGEAVYHAIQSANSEVIGSLTTGAALRIVDKFLGVGRTQFALREFCRAISETEPVDLPCLIRCAQSFVERQQASVGGHRVLATTAELIYAGDFAAAETLIGAQTGTRQRVSYAAAAEIMDSLQQVDVAKFYRQKAGNTNDYCRDLPLFQQELLRSLSQPDPLLPERDGPNVPARRMPTDVHKHQNLRKVFWITVAVISQCLTGIAFTLGTLSLVLLPIAWVTGDDSAWSLVSTFFWSFLLLLAAAKFLAPRFLRNSASLASQELARSVAATERCAPRDAAMLCFLLDWLEFSTPLIDDLPRKSLIRYALQDADATTGARLLIHCAAVSHWWDQQIHQHLRQTPAIRQQQLVAELRRFVATRNVRFPLYSALAKCLGGREATTLLATIAENLFEAAHRDEQDQKGWFSGWKRTASSSQSVTAAAVVRELPRPVRAEILLLPDRALSSSVRLLWQPLIHWPQASIYTALKTHPLEKLFLVLSFLGCILTLLTVTHFGRDVNSTSLFVVYVTVLLVGLSCGLWFLDWLGFLLIDRQPDRSSQLNHFLRNKQPPWHWSTWFPWIGGCFYAALLFDRLTNLASGRSGYGREFELDIERYCVDWAPIVHRYQQQRHQRSHSIAPPLYAILGPAGLADLLLLRLILRQGWSSAIHGPAFPPETWKRVTRLLTRPDWLGTSPGLLTETLGMPVAAEVVIQTLQARVGREHWNESGVVSESLDQRIDDQWTRINDLTPPILQRFVVMATALVVAVLAINPTALTLCQTIVGGPRFPTSALVYWYGFNMLMAAWYLPTCKSRLVRAGSLAVGTALFFVTVQNLSGVQDFPLPLSTPVERAGLLSAVNASPLPLIFFAPWIVATYRGSLLLLPSRTKLLAWRCYAILLVPLTSLVLVFYLQFGATMWIGFENCFHTSAK